MEEGRGIGAERAAAAWSVERPFRVEADFAVRFVIDLPDQLRRPAVGRPVGLPRHRLGPRRQRLYAGRAPPPHGQAAAGDPTAGPDATPDGRAKVWKEGYIQTG